MLPLCCYNIMQYVLVVNVNVNLAKCIIAAVIYLAVCCWWDKPAALLFVNILSNNIKSL